MDFLYIIYYWIDKAVYYDGSKLYNVSLSELDSKLVIEFKYAENELIEKHFGIYKRWNQYDSEYRYKDITYMRFCRMSSKGAGIELNYRDYYVYYFDEYGNKKKMFALIVNHEGNFEKPSLVWTQDGRFVIIRPPYSKRCRNTGLFIFEPSTWRIAKLVDYSRVSLFVLHGQYQE